MKKIIISLLFAMGMVTSSYAISLEGLSIGASLGQAGFYGVGEEKTDNQKSGVDHTKEAGAFRADVGSVFIEYNVGGIGIGIDYIPHTIETPSNKNYQAGGTGTGDDPDATNTVSGEFENHTTAYVIISNPAQGVLDGLLDGLYLKAGVVYVDMISMEQLDTGGSYPDVDTTGITAGLGYSIEAAEGISVRAEVQAYQYDDVSAANATDGTKTITITDMMSANAKLSIVKSF